MSDPRIAAPDVVRLWPTSEQTEATPTAERAMHVLTGMLTDRPDEHPPVLGLLDALSDNDLAAVQILAATIADVASATREARDRLGRPRT